mgnify:CR=1 FL=1
MNEIISVTRITPYGFQLEDSSYRKASVAVRNFSTKLVPCDLEIVDEDEKGVITKVFPKSFPVKKENGFKTADKIQTFREWPESKLTSMREAYIKDILVALIISNTKRDVFTDVKEETNRAIESFKQIKKAVESLDEVKSDKEVL